VYILFIFFDEYVYILCLMGITENRDNESFVCFHMDTDDLDGCVVVVIAQ
jgi:hypothetical protein